ncbi:amino acid adenylation domain-containing protein [Chamaesiphon sp. VAR_48_metabat_135_sub]|uniref:non-ribosomal peptide synthetase n=1 Tax=Chamaesiphon sp. VAR_48_metabat_135_sub TaxID=2964699 RepID=UPI00286AE90D|nr:amino acid adenylation domain-containing protein [Chamaesiphon sp. VAR_48_metabat_135_sub]
MSTLELLSELRLLGVQLSTDGKKLKCKAPNDTLTPRLRSALADRKAEIISFLHEGNRGVGSTVAEIPTVPRDRDLLLSFAQQRLWFLDRIEPNSSSYNISEAVQLTGELDLQILQQALDAIVAHHEAIRTNYLTVDGNPIQIINAPCQLKLEIVDLQQYPATEQQLEVQTYLHQASQKPFNLTTDLMLRCCLLQLAPNRHIFLATMHHIASDAWSMGLFWQQLGQVYNAFLQHQPNPLPPLPIQYADYAVWQREWLSSAVITQQLDYWKQQLINVNPVLDLPTDYPRPAIQTYAGNISSIDLSPQLTADLKALCRQEGATLFMTLLAAFQTLMSRQSGQEDFIIASPIAGRNRTEVEGLIGFFINTLLLNADLSGNPSFQALLGRVRQTALGAYAHQDVPFEKLIEELNPRRDLSRNPLFQVLFNMLNIEDLNLDLDGLTVAPIAIAEANSKFDLTLYVKEQDCQIHFDLAYNTDLFAPARMVEMLAQFEQLLTQIVAHPARQIQSYSLVTPNAQALLPNPRLSLSKTEYAPITATFTNWATQTPNQTAIIQAERTWTYQELATAAQAIAQLLRANQLSIGNAVAVSGDRSFGLIASMLGVLMSGGVLLNLDPNLPEARQQLMLTTAEAKYLLAVGRAGSIANLSAEIQILTINPDTGKTSYPETINDPNAAPIALPIIDAAAYIFFTSGTTGTPKGVLGTHQGLAHFLTWQRETFSIVPEDRAAQLTGLSFDVVLRDIFLPLTSGATLCLPSIAEDLTPGRILPWMECQQITILHTVPTLAQSWLMNVPTGVSLRTLRQIFFAGEPLRDTLINTWREHFPAAGEIVNLYGPTETTLAKCYYRVPKNIYAGIQPIGGSLPATQTLLFKPDRQLCGIGETGEIAIRTPFRTKGYINGPAENQSQFIENLFANNEDDLIYLTGDRGRYLPDGTLEILGRIDRQIKIRGVRIEPGEIAALLNQHPQIQATVVIAREDIPGDKRLVAYFVPKQNTHIQPSELRQFLKQQLPDYMVPSAFAMLSTLPLTPNGKIDTRALPAPDLSGQESAPNFVAARDEFQVQLTKIWQQVLGVRSISITDNFFELGGHSLLAIRLFSEIERIWGKNLPLATLFQAQTIEKLADIISQEGWSAPYSSLVQIQVGSTKPPLFCVHPIGGNVLEYYKLAAYLGEEQPVYGLQSLGLDGTQIPLRSIEAMAAHYITEMQIIQPNGPYFLVGYSFAGLVVYEIAQQLHRQGEKVALLALLDRTSPTFVPCRPSLLKSIKIHLYNLWLLDLKGRVKYFTARIKYKYIYKENFRKYMLDEWKNTLSPEYVNVFDANLQASQDYQTLVYPGKLTLFRCQIQPQNQALSNDLSWSDLVTGEIEIYPISAPHYDMLLEPHVRSLAEKLKVCIDRSLANIHSPID